MRFAVLASGNGTNLQALIDAGERGGLGQGQLVVVVCNRPGAHAIERARKHGIACAVIDHTEFPDRQAFEAAVLEILDDHRVEAVILAGFMRILTGDFIARFPNRVLNTHPALSPSFPGARAPQQAVEYGVKVTGCTVHFVDDGVDTGPIIFQAAVPVEPGDDADRVHKRIQKFEHKLLPVAVKLLAASQLEVEGRRVRILERTSADQ